MTSKTSICLALTCSTPEALFLYECRQILPQDILKIIFKMFMKRHARERRIEIMKSLPPLTGGEWYTIPHFVVHVKTGVITYAINHNTYHNSHYWYWF